MLKDVTTLWKDIVAALDECADAGEPVCNFSVVGIKQEIVDSAIAKALNCGLMVEEHSVIYYLGDSIQTMPRLLVFRY